MKEDGNNLIQARTPPWLLTVVSFIREYGRDYIEQELERNDIHGIVVSHGAIMALLFFEGPMSMHQIAKKIRRRKSTVTVLVRKLIKAGYVQEEISSVDKRYKVIDLTEKGRSVKDVFVNIGDSLNEVLWQGFGKIEQLELMETLNKIENNIKNVIKQN